MVIATITFANGASVADDASRTRLGQDKNCRYQPDKPHQSE
jgi:hypothetical protein